MLFLDGRNWAAGRSCEKVRCVETYQKTLPFKPGGKVRVETRNGEIRVRGWEKDEVKIEATKEAKAYTKEKAARRLKETKIKIERKDSEIDISTETAPDCTVNYEIFVPQRTDLSARNMNGWLGFSKLRGQLTAKLTNGWVNLCEILGTVNLEVTSGWVSIDKVSGTLNLEMTSGYVELEQTTGEISLRVVSGYIRGEISPEASRVALSTETGDIELSVPEDAEPVIYVKKGGTVRSDFPIFTTQECFKQAKAKPKIEVETTTGNIRIRKAK